MIYDDGKTRKIKQKNYREISKKKTKQVRQ